jgi:uncharacterized repeat protein (TIGR02543 family)
VSPLGTSTACFDDDGFTTSIKITATLESGYSISKWVVTKNGSHDSNDDQTSTTCSLSYSSSMSDIQIRLEVVSTPASHTLYVNYIVPDDAYNVPSNDYSHGTSTTQSVRIPVTTPQRSGYTFSYWSGDDGNNYDPGDYVEHTFAAVSYTVTLTAQWTKVNTYKVTVQYVDGTTNLATASPSSTSSSTLYFVVASGPTKSGYTFTYWSGSDGKKYYEGETASVTGTTSGWTLTLTAQWTKTETTGHVWIHNGTKWVQATPWIHNGTKWVKATPWIYSSGWKRCP